MKPPRPDRPSDACLLCHPRYDGTQWHWPRARSGTYVCDPCFDRLNRDLRAVRDEAARLSPVRQRNGTHAHPPGFRSTSPANDLAIALQDRRNPAAVEPGDVPDVLGELHSWAQLVREEEPAAALEGPASMDTECGLLLGHLTWVTRQPWVDVFSATVASLLSVIRAANGELEGRVPLGGCPDCGAPLYVRLTAKVVVCRCGAQWHQEQWPTLGRAIRYGQAS